MKHENESSFFTTGIFIGVLFGFWLGYVLIPRSRDLYMETRYNCKWDGYRYIKFSELEGIGQKE